MTFVEHASWKKDLAGKGEAKKTAKAAHNVKSYFYRTFITRKMWLYFSPVFFFHYSPDWIRIPPFSIGKNPQFNITIAAVNRHYRELASNRICIHTVYNGKAHNWLNKFNGKWKWNALNCAAHPMAYMLMKKKEHNILLAAKETVNICLSKKNITAHFFWLRMLHENMSM